jgi:folate-binding Fe-S cluster repair protein YgfZ
VPPSDLPRPPPILVDQSDWGRIRVAGADRVRFAQAMCTADVTKVGEGRFARAAILSAKGRVQSVVDIVNRGADLLLVCEPALTDKTVALLRKHAVMDEVEIELEPGPCHRQWGAPREV